MKERLKNNIAILKQHNLTHEPVYHITDGHKHEIDLINEIVEDCEEIFKDAEQGLIKRFPCKVGDNIYYIVDYGSVAGECLELEVGKIKSISLQEEGWWIYAVYDSGLTYWHKVDKKDYYLIKAEAEKKLKELKGEE